MGKLKTFEIFILNTNGFVHPGETLRGQLVIEAKEDIKLKEISVQCFGKCQVQWAADTPSSSTYDFQLGVAPAVFAEEVYINEAIICFPRDSHSSNILRKGKHTFNFRFSLPDDLPSSYISKTGYIHYVLKAVVNQPGGIDSSTRSFTVRSSTDLNPVASAQRPVRASSQITGNCLFRRSGICTANIILDRKGYVIGEVIPVHIVVSNNSNQEIRTANLVLKAITECKAQGHTVSTHNVLCKRRLGKVPMGDVLDTFDQQLKIPLGCPPNLRGCKYMKVRYVVELHLKAGLFSMKKAKAQVKLLVATVNFHRCEATGDSLYPPPSYEDIIPPSYEEAMKTMESSVMTPFVFDSKDQPQAEACSHNNSETTSELVCPSRQN